MMHEPDMYALVMQIVPERGNAVPTVSGHEAHGLFLELVRQVDPELSNALHRDGLSKHFTVSVLQPPPGRRRVDEWKQGLALRTTLLRSDLFPPFTRALLQQSGFPALRLGRVAFALADVFGTPESHTWAGYTSFATLAESVQPAASLTLDFVTPTYTTQGSMSGQGNKQRLNLLPHPQAMFGSLARRWNNLAPAHLGLDMDVVQAACDDVLVSRYTLQTEALRLRRNVQVGFVGRCTYELPPDPVQQGVLTLLADAAFYLGMGAKTTQGMGVCRRVKSGG